jgi:hypothetical protein
MFSPTGRFQPIRSAQPSVLETSAGVWRAWTRQTPIKFTASVVNQL